MWGKKKVRGEGWPSSYQEDHGPEARASTGVRAMDGSRSLSKHRFLRAVDQFSPVSQCAHLHVFIYLFSYLLNQGVHQCFLN